MLQYVLVPIAITYITFVLWQKLERGRKLPPGPIRWPILGSIPQLMMMHPKYPHLQLAGLAEKFGGIVSFGFGVHYSIVVSNYEIMMDLFRRPETNLERFRFDFLEQRNDYKNLGAVFCYGDVWKEQRKWIVKLLREFGFGRHTMDGTILQEVNDLILDIKQEIASSGGVWEVDFSRLSACQINIVWASVAGFRFDPHSPEINRQINLNLKIIDSLGPSNLLGAFPFLKIFPKLSGFRKHYELHRDSREFMKELIEDVKQRSQGKSEPESFLEAYLAKIEKEKHIPNTNFNEDQLELILMDLFLGSSDTTSALLSWLILYIGLHQEVQIRARDEIDRIYKDQSTPTSGSDLTRMPYVHALILEAMRHPPFIITSTARRVTTDLECAGYRIPAGTCLFQNFYPIFHDESFWGDPEVFRPERFLLANGTLNTKKTERIIQFGVGARICPGENLAMTTAFMFTVGLLRSFSFGLVSGREAKFELGNPSLSVKPKPFALQLKVVN